MYIFFMSASREIFPAISLEFLLEKSEEGQPQSISLPFYGKSGSAAEGNLFEQELQLIFAFGRNNSLNISSYLIYGDYTRGEKA